MEICKELSWHLHNTDFCQRHEIPAPLPDILGLVPLNLHTPLLLTPSSMLQVYHTTRLLYFLHVFNSWH